MSDHCGICGEELLVTARHSMGGSWKCPKGHFKRFQNYRSVTFEIGDQEVDSDLDKNWDETVKQLCESHPDYDAKVIEEVNQKCREDFLKRLQSFLDKEENQKLIKEQLKDLRDYKIIPSADHYFVLETSSDPSLVPTNENKKPILELESNPRTIFPVKVKQIRK